MPDGPKIAFFDLETAPNLSWTWGKWEQDVLDFERHWYLLCWSVKWADDKKIQTYALPDYPAFKKDPEDDKTLVTALWRMMNDADICIAHNGDNFDIKKANARFIFHGLEPPSPYKTIDTLKICRRQFAFSSNKLNDVAKYLGVGSKLPTTGFHLWKKCMRGDLKAFEIMKRYNARDVVILERVYQKLKAWHTTHPNLNLYSDETGCPTCQSKNVHRRGVQVIRTKIRQRLRCRDCGAWFSGEIIKA